MAKQTAQQAAGAPVAAQSGFSSADLQHMHLNVLWLPVASAGCFVLAVLLMVIRWVIKRVCRRWCCGARDVELEGGRDGTYTWSDMGGAGPRYERTSCADMDVTCWSDIGLGRPSEMLKEGKRLTNPVVNAEPVDEEEDRSGAMAIAAAMASLTESLTARNYELAYAGEPVEMVPDSPLSLPRPPQDQELSDDEWFVQLSAAPHNIDPSIVASGREYL